MNTCDLCLKEVICHCYPLKKGKNVIYLCKKCLLWGVKQIHGEMITDDPIGGKTCLNCEIWKKLDEYDKKKGELKSWCRDCCENQSKRLKSAVKCTCGKFAGVSGKCGDCVRKAIKKLHFPLSEAEEMSKISKAARDPRWSNVGDEDDLPF